MQLVERMGKEFERLATSISPVTDVKALQAITV